MTAPTSAHVHDLDEIASMLRDIRDGAARLDAQIAEVVAAIERAEAMRPTADGAEGGAVLTPTEYHRISGRSRSWVEARCLDGTLPARRVGSRWLLTRKSLEEGGWL